MIPCLKGYAEYLVEQGKEHSEEHIATYFDGDKTCLAEDGHPDGEHEWTPDNEIMIRLTA